MFSFIAYTYVQIFSKIMVMAFGWDLRAVVSNPGRNLQAIFDPGWPQKIKQIFPGRLKFDLND